MMIHDAMDALRRFVNERQIRWQLQQAGHWDELCSAMDTVEDTDLALDSFSEDTWPPSDGAAYLMVYGVLQALQLQADAARSLAKVSEIQDRSWEREIKDVLVARKKAAGHPVFSRDKGVQQSHVVNRFGLSPYEFEVFTYARGKPLEAETVRPLALIETQRPVVSKVIVLATTTLRQRHTEHCREFLREPLANPLADVDYFVAKVSEGLGGCGETALVGPAVDTLRERLQEVLRRLEQRGLSRMTWEALDHDMSSLEESLDEAVRMTAELQARPSDRSHALARMVGEVLPARVAELRTCLESIDEMYVEHSVAA